MRRGAVFESAEQESEFVLLLFFVHAQGREHLFLQLPLEDADGSAADLVPVQHHVVGVCLDAGIGMLQVFGRVFDDRAVVDHRFDLRGFGRSEGVMTGHPAVAFFIVFKKREVEHPEQFEFVGPAHAQALGHFEAQFAAGFPCSFLRAGQYQYQVAGLGAGGFGDGFQFFFAVEFIHAAFKGSVGITLNEYQALHADLRTLHPFRQFIGLLAGIFAAARDGDGDHGFGVVENGKFSRDER